MGTCRLNLRPAKRRLRSQHHIRPSQRVGFRRISRACLFIRDEVFIAIRKVPRQVTFYDGWTARGRPLIRLSAPSPPAEKRWGRRTLDWRDAVLQGGQRSTTVSPHFSQSEWKAGTLLHREPFSPAASCGGEGADRRMRGQISRDPCISAGSVGGLLFPAKAHGEKDSRSEGLRYRAEADIYDG